MIFKVLHVLLGLLATLSAESPSLYSGYTNVQTDGNSLHLSICHVMEVADVVADFFLVTSDTPDEDILTAIALLTEEICTAHPHLLCSRLVPAPVRDLGMPHIPVNKQPTMIRQGYSAFDLADCVASVSEFPFSAFAILAKSFAYLFETQDVYLTNLQRCGFRPAVILDCGAHVGQWSKQMKQHRFPEAKVFMIEANADQADALAEWNIPFEITLLADEDGIETVYHKNQDPETSSGNSIFRENSVSEVIKGNFRQVRMRTQTIDSVVAKNALGAVEFLKLDLQGSEWLALQGARETLRTVEVIQTEMHLVNYNEGAPKFLDVYSFLDSKGFALYDIGEIQKFGVKKQEEMMIEKVIGMDMIFVRKTSALWDEQCTLFPKPGHLDLL